MAAIVHLLGEAKDSGVPFTRVYPDGSTRLQSIDRPRDIVFKARRFCLYGGEFGVALLDDGRVSLCAAWTNQAGDRPPVALERTSNGPEMLDAIDRLVRAADAAVERMLN